MEISPIFELGLLLVSPYFAMLCVIFPTIWYSYYLVQGGINVRDTIVCMCVIILLWVLGVYIEGSTATKKDILSIYQSKEYKQDEMKKIALAYIRASANKQDSQKNQDDKINNDFNEMLKALGITTEGGVK